MARLIDSTGDPAIPTLAAVLDPAELAKQLSVPAFAQRRWDTSEGIQLRVLKWWKASRCTFEIALKTASGCQELIGKVYAEDRADIFTAMEGIRRAGFDSEAGFAIPQPVAYLESLRLLLYEKVPGTRAKTLILGSNESERVMAVERCARWLARFQALAPHAGPVMHLNDYLVSSETASRGLAIFGRPLTDKASQLLGQLNHIARKIGEFEVCASHGTYTPGQVLLADGCTFTVDWDTCNVTDPSRDVARFLVELKRLGLKYFGSLEALDPSAELFLKSYLAAGSSDITCLAFQKAAIFLERAKNDVDKQARGWRERAEAMLEEGLRTLDQPTHAGGGR